MIPAALWRCSWSSAHIQAPEPGPGKGDLPTASTKVHNDANEAKQFFAENSATPSGGNATARRRQYDW
jgi:hypothetical protein